MDFLATMKQSVHFLYAEHTRGKPTVKKFKNKQKKHNKSLLKCKHKRFEERRCKLRKIIHFLIDSNLLEFKCPAFEI